MYSPLLKHSFPSAGNSNPKAKLLNFSSTKEKEMGMNQMRFNNPEATLRWISNAIRDYDREAYINGVPQNTRSIMREDLLANIKLVTDMELGHENDEGPSYE